MRAEVFNLSYSMNWLHVEYLICSISLKLNQWLSYHDYVSSELAFTKILIMNIFLINPQSKLDFESAYKFILTVIRDRTCVLWFFLIHSSTIPLNHLIWYHFVLFVSSRYSHLCRCVQITVFWRKKTTYWRWWIYELKLNFIFEHNLELSFL